MTTTTGSFETDLALKQKQMELDADTKKAIGIEKEKQETIRHKQVQDKLTAMNRAEHDLLIRQTELEIERTVARLKEDEAEAKRATEIGKARIEAERAIKKIKVEHRWERWAAVVALVFLLTGAANIYTNWNNDKQLSLSWQQHLSDAKAQQYQAFEACLKAGGSADGCAKAVSGDDHIDPLSWVNGR